jgi:thiol-disulfide isomerase/thioredoxin
MKIKISILTLIFSFRFFTIFAQTFVGSNFEIELPEDFKFDSMFIYKESNSIEKRDTILFGKDKHLIFKDFFSSKNKSNTNISIFFKNNNYNIIDTLYLVHSGGCGKIKINNYLEYKRTSKFWELSNLFNFEYLYSNYLSFINPTVKKINEKINFITRSNIDSIDILKQKLTKQKFLFLNKNIKNPYVLDIFSNFILNDSEVSYSDAVTFYNNSLKKIIKDNFIIKDIKLRLAAKDISKKINVKAPDFTVKTFDEKLIKSDDFKGSYILLNFWAMWCKPCVEELPILKEIYSNVKNKNIIFLSISLDINKSDANSFLKKNNINWIKAYSNRAILSSFGVNPIPHIFLIDTKGVIIFNSMSNDTNSSSLSKLIKILKII